MEDKSKLKGYQLAAFNAIDSLDVDHALLLSVDWPTSQIDVLDGLINLAGLPRGSATITAASTVWSLAPSAILSANANMSVTVAMPAQPVKDPNEAIYGMWASKRAQRESRYQNLMKGNVSIKSLVLLGDGLYFMFSDLAAIISTAEALADAVAKGLFELEDDTFRQSLRTWRRERAKNLTLDLSDEEREANWKAVGLLLNPAFREMLGNIATVFEARADMVAFDDNAVRQATGGKTSVPRLQKTIMAAAQYISDNVKKLRDVLDSQSDLRAEIDAALVFLRNEEVQTMCGVKDYTPETADAGVAKVLAHFGNTSGAPAIQLGYDWRELFLRLADVLQQDDGVIDAQDLFYVGESASDIQSDAAFVEFGFDQEEKPAGATFQAQPLELAGSRASTGFTKKWQLFFLKAKVDFGFSFSESRE